MREQWRPVVLSLLMVVIGVSLASLAFNRAGNIVIPGGLKGKTAPLVCDGRALSDAVARKRSARVDVKLIGCRLAREQEMQKSSGTVRLYVYGGMPHIIRGSAVRFKARFKEPVDYRNGGGFSWRRHLAARGIGAVASVSGAEWLIAEPPSYPGVLSRMRQRLDTAIAGTKPQAAAGVLRALVTGRRDAVEEDVRLSFQGTGLAHLLAISGLHVGYIALFIFLCARFVAGRWTRLLLHVPVQKIAAVFTLPCLWGFIVMVGAPLSAVRAGIMLSVYLVGVLLARRQNLVVTLAIAALIIVAIDPLAVFEISFQLSFVSVLAIILIAPRLLAFVTPWFSEHTEWYWRLLWRACQLAAVTFAATIGSAPLVAYHFNLITGMGLIANLIAVPWMGVVVMPLAMIASITTFAWPWLATTLLWPAAAWSVNVMLMGAHLLAAATSSSVVHAAPSTFEVFMIYAALALIVFWRVIPYRRIAFVFVVVPLVLDAGWWHVRPLMTNKLEMTFLDVGQGEATFVRFPGGTTWLIDGGGKHGSAFDVGKNVVVPALLRKGIHSVDQLVLSHPHHDHYRGLAAVAEYFHPKLLWTNGFEPPEVEQEEWDEFEERLQAVGVDTIIVARGDTPVEVGGVKVEILYPDDSLPRDIEVNDTSLVMKLTYNDVSILFTGDLEKGGEETLLANGDDLSATVLKVGHHGSDTSSTREFITAVKPTIAVISVGQLNPYGMPDRAVLERFRLFGTQIYRTDYHGAITVSTDGRDVSVDTVVSGE